MRIYSILNPTKPILYQWYNHWHQSITIGLRQNQMLIDLLVKFDFSISNAYSHLDSNIKSFELRVTSIKNIEILAISFMNCL